MKIIKLLFFLIVLTTNNELFGQDETICFTYSYKNKTFDGIYLNLNQFLENNPIPRSRIMSRYDPERYDYFEKVLSQENINITDNIGEIMSVPLKNIWGYANNRNIYVNLKNQFNPIIHLGRICLVIIEDRVLESNIIPVVAISPRASYLSIPIYIHKKPHQYLFDLESGKLFNYNIASLKILLTNDKELIEEYNNLTKRNQEKLKFRYLSCYNARHPLYIKK